MRYNCPFCDYVGDSRGSIEGHISGKSDSLHKGKVGRMYRSDIEETGEATTVTEKMREKAGIDVSKQQSVREELASFRKVVEDVYERAQSAEKASKTARNRTVDKQEMDDVKKRLSNAEEMIETLAFLAFQEIRKGDEYRCPQCNVTVERPSHPTYTYDDFDFSEYLFCPNCENTTMAQTDSLSELDNIPEPTNYKDVVDSFE
jgi:rubrerythrin